MSLAQVIGTDAEDDQTAGASPEEAPIPDLITHVTVYPMAQHDDFALEPALCASGQSSALAWR